MTAERRRRVILWGVVATVMSGRHHATYFGVMGQSRLHDTFVTKWSLGLDFERGVKFDAE